MGGTSRSAGKLPCFELRSCVVRVVAGTVVERLDSNRWSCLTAFINRGLRAKRREWAQVGRARGGQSR